MSGWFAVKRGITDHHIFKGRPERLAVWMWLLDNAAWKDTTHDIQGRTIRVPRGSVCASTRHMATEIGVGHQVVRTVLKRLQGERMVNTASTHGKNVITLCNYDKYQNPKSSANTAPNTALTQDQHSTNTQKEQGNNTTKEDTNVSFPKKPQRRKSRISEDAVISEAQRKAAGKRGLSQQEAEAQFNRFKNDALSKGKLFVDWDRAFVSWLDSPYFSLITDMPKIKTINGGKHDTASHERDQTLAIEILAAARAR